MRLKSLWAWITRPFTHFDIARFLMSTPGGGPTGWSWQTYPPADPVPKGTPTSWIWEALSASLSEVAGALTIGSESGGTGNVAMYNNSDPTASHFVTTQAKDTLIAITAHMSNAGVHAPTPTVTGVSSTVPMTSLWENHFAVGTTPGADYIHVRLSILTNLSGDMVGTNRLVDAPSAGSHRGILLGTRILRPACA